MKKLILILSLIIIEISSFSQGNFFGSYSKKSPIVNGDIGLYCGSSYARIYLGEAYGAHIKRFGILYCDDDCGGYLPIAGGAWIVEWTNPVSVDFNTQVSAPLPTSLVENVRYWYKAFIETNDGIFYSSISQRVSPICSGTPPTVVVCTAASDITLESALACGQVTLEGSSSVTSYGICYSTSQNPTISSSTVSGSGPISGFTASLTGLIKGTTYYYRAYAQNDAGISYSNEYSFTTLSQLQPTLITNAITSITTTTAISGGHILTDGNAPIIEKGVQWSLNSGFSTIAGSTSDGTGTGSFASSITGLNCGTTYYVRAYATNTAGTGYGSTVSFVSGYLPSEFESTITLYSYIYTDNCSSGNFTSSFASACQARTDYNNVSCTNHSITGDVLKCHSYAVGSQLYGANGLGTYCKYKYAGYYWNRADDKIVQIDSNGIIQSITPCP